MGGIIPSEDAFNRMADATRHYEGTYRDATKEGKRRVILGGGGRDFRKGFLRDDLDAPASALGPPTSAVVCEYKRNTTTNVLEHVGEFTVYNYDTTLTLERETYVKCEFIDGQWEIYWAACTPDVSLSSSC